MTAKFKQIIAQLNALITFKVDKSMDDEDFIADIDAINLLSNLYEDLGLDCSGVFKRMSTLYPELVRRINGKENIQYAVPLIKTFYNFIYGRADNRGQAIWCGTFNEMCRRVVEAYRKEPLIESTDYLFALDTVSRLNDEADNPDIKEYKEIISSYLDDIEDVCLVDKIKRVRAYERSKHLFVADRREEWAEASASLMDLDISHLDDSTLILWREITDLVPLKVLKKRVGHSKQMRVEYLQALVFTEFEKARQASDKRKLSRSLKTLNDNLINDIIPLKIDSGMSVSTLHALETIFYLRLQLAQADWDDKEPIYNSLCRTRFEQIAKALKKKYKTAGCLNEKIEILERLVAIGMTIDGGYFSFVLEEAGKLKEMPNLTYAQKLRLDWLPDIAPGNESQIVAALLPEATSSFEMATLALISDFVTAEEREAIFNRYFDLFDSALSSRNIAELGKLLIIAAHWNSDPAIRPRLTEATRKAQTIEALPLPDRQVNAIAAEIFARIDSFIGKTVDIPA